MRLLFSALFCVSLVLLPIAQTRGQGKDPNKEKRKTPAQGQKVQVNSLGVKFARVPKGAFWMGECLPPVFAVTNAVKQVEINQDFDLGVHEVTQRQWAELMGKNPSYFSRTGIFKEKVKDISDADLKQFPVENVSWDQVQQFLKKLNEKEKASGWVYRLPTEAEWEYACRGGATLKEDCSFHFYFAQPSNDLSSQQANFHGGFPEGKAAKGPYLDRTCKVGSYAPNRLGLYDMHGNVAEWCQDWYQVGQGRVFRGGSWNVPGGNCRAARRSKFTPDDRRNYLGFRLARSSSGK